MSIFISDVGVQIKLYTGVDISAATTANVRYKKPDASTGSWTGASASTYYVTYTTTAGVLDQNGDWEFQAYVVTPAFTKHGGKLKVFIDNHLAV
jgi:hypothetical protein